MRYRLIVGRRREWPWRETRDAAVKDAIDGGHAERDEHDKTRLWWHPLANIETEEHP
jgi:hypothetical protein